MSAIQFIKDHGVDKAREVVEGAPDGFKGYNDVIKKYTRGVWFSRDVLLCDIKRLVESVDIINQIGGLDEAKNWLEKARFGLDHGHFFTCIKAGVAEKLKRNKQAIADYEAIGGEHV